MIQNSHTVSVKLEDFNKAVKENFGVEEQQETEERIFSQVLIPGDAPVQHNIGVSDLLLLLDQHRTPPLVGGTGQTGVAVDLNAELAATVHHLPPTSNKKERPAVFDEEQAEREMQTLLKDSSEVVTAAVREELRSRAAAVQASPNPARPWRIDSLEVLEGEGWH